MARLRFKRLEAERAPGRQGKQRPCRCVCVFLLLAFAGVATGSIPSATVPPSSYQSGLINTPNPIDPSANLPITGNVAGGKHFRGVIPYESTRSFHAPLGSTSLDSFLRYSAIPEPRTNFPQNHIPYYSPSGSVATTVPGYQGVFSPSSPRIAGGLGQLRTDQPVDMMGMAEVPQVSTNGGGIVNSGMAASPRLRYWPMSPSPGEMRDIISDELGPRLDERPLSPTGEPLMTPDEYQQRLERLRQGVDRIQTDAAQPEQTLNSQSAAVPAQPPLQQLPPTTLQPDQATTQGLRTEPLPDTRLDLYDPSAGRETTLSTPPGETPLPGPGDAEPGKLPALQRIEETSQAFDATARFLNRTPDEKAGRAANRFRSPSDMDRAGRDIAERSPTDAQPSTLNPSARDARQAPATVGSLTQKQFDHYLAAAQLYMQQGRYYRAADSFTLASVYIPHDVRVHLGKSHALLAAGEYVSSAESLARAIELDARHAFAKVDLVEILGGPDAFVQRITNLEEKAAGADASQLQFLLAYVYFQMDLLSEARTAIDAARNGLPSSVAADLLETALQGTPTK